MTELPDYKIIMNDPVLWIMCIPAVCIAALQAVLFYKKAQANSELVGLTSEDCKKAFKVGLTGAVGPALSSAVVMLTLMGSLGAAFTWLRLCFIGSAAAELTAATVGSSVIGQSVGGANYDAMGLSLSFWACTLNAMGWLFVAGAFGSKLDTLKNKIGGGDSTLLSIISSAALIGSIGYLAVGEVVKSTAHALVFAVSAVVMLIVSKFAVKWPKLQEHSLSIVIVIGLGVACVLLATGIGVK